WTACRYRPGKQYRCNAHSDAYSVPLATIKFYSCYFEHLLDGRRIRPEAQSCFNYSSELRAVSCQNENEKFAVFDQVRLSTGSCAKLLWQRAGSPSVGLTPAGLLSNRCNIGLRASPSPARRSRSDGRSGKGFLRGRPAVTFEKISPDHLIRAKRM